MTTIRESAMAYKPKGKKNIAELEKVSIELQLEQRDDIDKYGKKYEFTVAVIDGEEYRVPGVVLGNLKILLEDDPALTHFKVLKTGLGKETRYNVIPVSGEASASSPSYPKVMNVILPDSTPGQKQAYDELVRTKAVLQDKFL